MNKKWFECKVKYMTVEDTGVRRLVTKPFIVDALSFTEAESRINSELKAHISEEFRVVNIRVTNYSEIFYFEGGESWFKSKVSLIAYDEESGKERKVSIYLLVQANDAKQAYENTILAMKGTMGEYSIPSISETNVEEVLSYVEATYEKLEVNVLEK
jgi:hypothetical protein